MSRWILSLTIFAALSIGLLAGGNVDRSLVAMPAWRDLGWVAWAAFSQHADLGHGLVVYPIMAIGGTVAAVAAAILFAWSGRSPRGAAVPLFIAAAMALISLPFSFEAAPYMLRLRHIDSGDLAALGQAFSGFEFWGRLQGLCHLAGFGALVWALIALGRPAAASRTVEALSD